MLRIGPGAARAIEPVRLVHAEKTASLLYNGHLTTNGIRHGFQSAPPRGSSIVAADAGNIVFAHHALHRREMSDGSNQTDIFRNASRMEI
jgi:hypothetical protein